ncbi:MAG: glycosyltransferase family 39 protein [Dehalococcoidia bacterium]|nr:glycosyltransferase family 39 protein [Dehalococcoidia bacterium]
MESSSAWLRGVFRSPGLWLAAGGLLLVLAITIVTSPLYQRMPGNDSGTFYYVADQMLHGKVPYRDVWDHKPPGIYFVDGFGLLIAGSRWGVWALEFMAIAIAAIFGFLASKRAFGTLPALVGSAAWLFAMPYLLTGGNLPEEYALPLQFGLLYLFQRSVRRGQPGWDFFLMGLLTGGLFILKYNLIAIPLSIALVVVFANARLKDWRGLFRSLAAFTLGSALILAAVSVYFLSQGALADFWEASVVFNVGRASSSMASPVAWLKPPIIGMGFMAGSGLGVMGLAGWIAGVMYLLSRSQLTERMEPLLLVSVVSLPIGIILIASSGHWSSSLYFMAWLPTLAVLCSFLLYLVLTTKGAVFRPWRTPYTLSTQSLIALSLFLAMAFLPASKIVADLTNLGEFQARRQSWGEAAKYVEASSYPKDTVMVWGVGPSINFTAQREAPTRFANVGPLFGSSPYYQGTENRQRFEEILRDIQTHKPKLIIDTSSTFGVSPLDASKWEEWFQSHEGGAAAIAGRETELQRISEYVLANYHVVTTLEPDGWLVYRYTGE